MVIKEERGEGINWEFGINIYILLYRKYINKDLLHSTGNSQYFVIAHFGKKSEKQYTYIYVYILTYICIQWLSSKESACSVEAGFIPGSGGSPGGRNGNSLQYSYLKNSMDRGAWRAIVQGVTKSRT